MSSTKFNLWDDRGGNYDVSIDLPDGYQWYTENLEASRFATAAVVFNGWSSTGGGSVKELRVIDLPTSRVLAGRSLSANEFLLPTQDRDTSFHIGQVSGGALTIQSYDYSLSAKDSSLSTPIGATVTVNLPSGFDLNSVYLNQYALTTGGTGYVIVSSWDSASSTNVYKLFSSTNGGTATPVALPTVSGTISWMEMFTSDNTLMLRVSSGNWGKSDYQATYWSKSAASSWQSVDENVYWTTRSNAIGETEVVRDGSYAYDLKTLLKLGDGQTTYIDEEPIALSGGGVIVRASVSYLDEKFDVGYEHWLVLKEGQVVAEKAFKTGAGMALRVVESSDKDHVYFQQLDVSFTGTAGAVKGITQKSTGATLYKIAVDKVAGVLASASSPSQLTLAGLANVEKVGSYSWKTLSNSGTLAAGKVAIIEAYHPVSQLIATDKGAIVLSAVWEMATKSGTHYISRIESNGTVTATTEIAGQVEYTEVVDVSTILLETRDDSGHYHSYVLNPSVGKLTELQGDVSKMGTDQSDTLLAGEGEATQIFGGKGNDSLIGNSNKDALYGGAGDDSVIGQGGDDTLVGGTGNDFMDGGDGDNDVAVFSGASAGYRVETSSSGQQIVTDIDKTDGDEGVDTLVEIELIRYESAGGSGGGGAPKNASPTGSVSISGTAIQGETLTASNTLADADGMGTVSYQWKAGDSNISGATGSTYTLTKSEVGKAITVVASYTDGASTAESVSSGQTSTVTGVANVSVKVTKVIAAPVPLYESDTSSTTIGIYQVTGGATYASQANLTVGTVLPSSAENTHQRKILSASGGNWQPSTGAKILGVDGTSDSGAYVLQGMVSGKAYKSFAVWSFTDTADGTAVQASSATPQALDASSSQVTSYETMFEKDLNGDGSIGVNVTKVKSVGDEFTFIDANGEPATLGYFLGSDNYYYVAKSGLAVDDELTNANKLLTTKGKAWLPVSGTKTLVVKQTSDGAGYSIVGSGPNSQDVYTKFAKYDYVDNSTDHTTKPKSDKPTTITTAQVLGYEDELGLDINGDGAIGNSVSEVVFEGSAGKSIYSTGDGSYVIADAGLSGGDSLPSGYTPITVAGTKTFASQLQGEITGVAELSPSGYDLVSVKQVGSKLNYFSTLISEYGVAGKSKALTADKLFENERNYQQDLNGDGLIGDVVVDVVFAGDDFGGAWSLYQMSAGGYVIAEAGLTEGDAPTTGVSLRSGTKAWAPATGSKIAGVGETEQGNYELLTSATKGTTTTFSASVVSPDTGIVGKATVLTLAQLYAKEVTYGVDFTGDGDIGDLIESVIADNGTTGVYQMKSGAYVLGESGFGEGESTSGAVLMSGKAQWALGKGQTVEGAAVSEDGSKVSLLLETRSGLKITAAEQTFLVESGLAVGKAVTLSKPAQLQAAEIKYQVNLSDDDYIGVVTDGKEALVWDDGAGHVYALYKTPQTWANADKAAKALGGTLAVLTDDAMSFDFYANVSNAIDSTEYKKTAAVDGGGAAYVWLGATDDASSTSIKGASEGNWLWADGSELSTSRAEWGSGALGSEPDNTKVGSATQNYLAMGLENWPKDSADGAGYGDTGYWNDLVGSDKLFYVVEWTIA